MRGGISSNCAGAGAGTKSRWRFFFQAEDGIRGFTVTGVQTCALPICHAFLTEPGPLDALLSEAVHEITGLTPTLSTGGGTSDARFIKDYCPVIEFGLLTATIHKVRSEERRVGKGDRCGWSA